MVVISSLQLVLDDDRIVEVLRNDVGLKTSDANLAVHELQVHADRLAEQLEITRLGEPGREIIFLAFPDVPSVDTFERAQFRMSSGGRSSAVRGFWQ